LDSRKADIISTTTIKLLSFLWEIDLRNHVRSPAKFIIAGLKSLNYSTFVEFNTRFIIFDSR
jgi:hypothetical protein